MKHRHYQVRKSIVLQIPELTIGETIIIRVRRSGRRDGRRRNNRRHLVISSSHARKIAIDKLAETESNSVNAAGNRVGSH